MSSVRENIRINLTALLRQNKMTQKKLADTLQLSQTAVTNWMKGKNAPDIDILAIICDICGISVTDIVSPPSVCSVSYEGQLLVRQYMLLDPYGKELVRLVLGKELERVQAKPAEPAAVPISELQSREPENVISLPFYDLPVSAGTGIYLQDDSLGEIEAVDSPLTRRADFALRISGDSMDPRYHDGEILLVQQQEMLEYGELGIFILNGEGYFKKLGKNELVSLNHAYPPIAFGACDDIKCVGKVIGRLEEA